MGDLIQLHLPLGPPDAALLRLALARARTARAKQAVAEDIIARYEACLAQQQEEMHALLAMHRRAAGKLREVLSDLDGV